MAFLKSGVLVKLLEDISGDENGLEGDHKPVLLQIRSIIPLLEEGSLWPIKGFYVKVCDVTHAMYVTFPEEENEMILSDILKLGQFIYAQKLEKSHPVPILRGITPLPGRRPCEGTPEDIFPGKHMERFFEASITECIVEKGVISEKKINQKSSDLGKLYRAVSDSEALIQQSVGLKEGNEKPVRSLSTSKLFPSDQNKGLDCSIEKSDLEKINFDGFGDFPIRTNCSDDDSDSSDHSTFSSFSSSRLSKRRSWTQSELLGVKEMFDSSKVRPRKRRAATTPERKDPPRSHSANVSPVRSVRYDSSDDNASSTRRRRSSLPGKRSVKNPEKSKVPVSVAVGENSHPITLPSFNDMKGAETRVSWDSLPSSLLKFGKEVVHQRDVALRGAVEAVQEACAAERLIGCLSTYSEFQSNEADDLQPTIDKFFELQDELDHTRLIMQSLTNISLLRTSDTNSSCTIKEVLDLAVERKKNANVWIKSAVASDLLPFSRSTKSKTAVGAKGAADTMKRSCIACSATKPKGPFIVPKQKKYEDMSVILTANKDDHLEWARGSTQCATTDLAAALQDECQRWFLGCADKYLDEVESKASSTQSDSKMTAIMFKIKRIYDWLDALISKETNSLKGDGKENSTLSDAERETCVILKNKIYGILLKNVERTAMAS